MAATPIGQRDRNLVNGVERAISRVEGTSRIDGDESVPNPRPDL
jgi:hypothetical protein